MTSQAFKIAPKTAKKSNDLKWTKKNPSEDFVKFVEINTKRHLYDALEKNAHDRMKDNKAPLILHTFTCFILDSFKKKNDLYKRQLGVLTSICKSFDMLLEYPFVILYCNNICKIAAILEEEKEWSDDVE